MAMDQDENFFQIPIKFTIAKYNVDLTNSWAGGIVSIDNQAATVMATAMGAGEKDSRGAFTGVLMGSFVTIDQKIRKGLYGFAQDLPTFGLDALTGDAFFKGTIEAKAGKIGGWTIAPYSNESGMATYDTGIYSDHVIGNDGEYIRFGLKLSRTASDFALYCVKFDANKRKLQNLFGISHDGSVYISNI
jgi:hypothetical protein